MAVTTTVQDILSAAYGRSAKNARGSLGTEATELTKLVGRLLRGAFAVGARVNPTFFAQKATIGFGSDSWTRPEYAEAIMRIEKEDGTEVVVVPFDDRAAEPTKPALYRFGQKFYTAGNVLDPVAGNLVFWCSRRCDVPAAPTDVLDSQWVESYNDLLIAQVAIYLALKDNRGEEVPLLTGERDQWFNLFVAFLEHETANERRRFGHIRYVNTESLVTLKALFLSGGDA